MSYNFYKGGQKYTTLNVSWTNPRREIVSSALKKPVRVKRANLNIIAITSCHSAPAVDVVAAATHCLKVEDLRERGQQY